jgi:uncharacterized iron-regulated membrane protein
MAMEQNAGSNSLLGKVIGGFVAAIVAPTLTGVAVWYIQKKFDDQKPEVPPNAPPQAVASAQPGAPVVVRSEAKTTPEPAKPTPP